MTKKDWIKVGIAVLLGALIGFLVFKLVSKPKTIKETVEIEKPVYYEDLVKIHDLEKEIENRDKEIGKLKKRIGEIKDTVIIEKERVALLPPDAGVLFLRDNLEEYTGTGCDSLPSLNEDSLIIMDNNNLVSINSVFIDYYSGLEIMKNQEQIIYHDSIIIDNYDSIHKTETGIRENLEYALKKERKKRNIWMGVGIGASITAIIVGVLCYGRGSH